MTTTHDETMERPQGDDVSASISEACNFSDASEKEAGAIESEGIDGVDPGEGAHAAFAIEASSEGEDLGESARLRTRVAAQAEEMRRLRAEVQRLRGEVSRLSERLKVSNEKVVEMWRSGGGVRKRSKRTSRRGGRSVSRSALQEAMRRG